MGFKPVGLLFIAVLLYAFIKFLKDNAPGALREDRRGRKTHYGLNKEYIRTASTVNKDKF